MEVISSEKPTEILELKQADDLEGFITKFYHQFGDGIVDIYHIKLLLYILCALISLLFMIYFGIVTCCCDNKTSKELEKTIENKQKRE
jgi:hypothetical protein